MDKNKKAGYIKTLKSENEKLVVKAIDDLRKEGENELLYNLISLYQHSDNKNIKDKVAALFCDLKNQESAPYVVDIIEDDSFSESKPMLVSSCWQSRLDYADYLEVFIKLTITAPFLVAFEAFTVIENIESKVTRERKSELIDYTKSLLHNVPEENLSLAGEIPQLIEQFDVV